MMQISSCKLIALRKRANLTAEALAQESGIGRATITRIENGHTTSSTSNTVKKLAEALRCRPEDLATPPEADDQVNPLSNRFTMKVEMSAACQNALSLIAARYREQPTTILELAPLLFDIIARESLMERRHNLEQLSLHRDAINAMSNRFPHLSGRYTWDWEAQDFDGREEHSIARDDLRGEFVHADETLSDHFYPHEYDDTSSNPFVAHLRQRYERIAAEGYEAARIDGISHWLGPDYELGFSEASKLAGNDEELADAIVRGVVPIPIIPKDLLKEERTADRQEWMRERIAEHAQRTSALFEKLGLGVELLRE